MGLSRARSGAHLAAALTALTLLCLGSDPAAANHPTDLAPRGKSFTHTHPNRAIARPCIRKEQKLRHGHPRRCDGSLINYAGEQHRATARDIAAHANFVNSGGETLEHAAKLAAKRGTGPIYWRSFWQWFGTDHLLGGSHDTLLYNSKNEGYFYYDGEDVWIDPNRGTNPGDHTCTNYSMTGYSVSTQHCDERWRETDRHTEYVQCWDVFDVSLLWKGFPIKDTKEMHVNVHADGGLSFWWGDERRDTDPPSKEQRP